MDNAIILLSAILGLKILEDGINIFHYWKAKPLTENGKKKRLIRQFIDFKRKERQDLEMKRSIVLISEKSLKDDKQNKEKLIELEKAKKKMNLETIKKLERQILNIEQGQTEQGQVIVPGIKQLREAIMEMSDKIIKGNQELMAAKKVLSEVGKKKGITGKEYIAKMKVKEAEEKEKQLKEIKENGGTDDKK